MAGTLGARLLLVCLLLGLLVVPATGQELAAWFAADPRAGAYAGVRGQLEEILEAARGRKLPVTPLIEKLTEGASKGVPSEMLLEALRDTVERLSQARDILEQASEPSTLRAEDVQAVGLLLRRGLPQELAVELIAFGLRAGRPMPVVRAACDAVTSLAAVAGLGPQDTWRVGLEVGTLLLGGRLSVSDYGSLAPIYLSGKAAGLESGEIIDDVIIATLGSGGGIRAMKQKIDRGQAARSSGKKTSRPSQAGPKEEPPGQADDKPGRPDHPEHPEHPDHPDKPEKDKEK